MDEDILWKPDIGHRQLSGLAQFFESTRALHNATADDYPALHHWSISEPAQFWGSLWDAVGIIGEKGETVLTNATHMIDQRFFPEARLNFTENLLRRSGPELAIAFMAEDQIERQWSWDELHEQVSRLQQAFRAEGVRAGDVVAAMLPNMPETVAAMLAATSMGAIWSSCSPDFGVRGALDRFSQLSPKLFLVCDGYWYAGKRLELDDKARDIARELKAERTIVVAHLGTAETVAAGIDGAVTYAQLTGAFAPQPVVFERLPFAHPLCVVFSSGTTGLPKCIIHSAGGVLLQHMKEHQLHSDIGPGDKVFYFTTCGWMMWNWLISALASRAAICLYDGSPFHPTETVLFDYAQKQDFTFFGTSAKFIDTARKSELSPMATHDLAPLRSVASTGSPLAPSGFRYVYEHIKADVHLASISGGTDILSCFVLGIPTLPVRIGTIQGPGLGMAVEVWDDDGPCGPGQKGELVCTGAFPSMPLGFWNDPDRARYRATYFARFDNVWCHSDFAEWQDDGSIVIHGRSDATLNPGGVRIGTAEIYGQVEQIPQVSEALCISQQFDNDVRVVLFVRLADDATLTPELEQEIRRQIRSGATPRHVPARIVAVADLPRTKSGKIAELVVRDIVHGRPPMNTESLANPEALSLFTNIAALNH